MTEERTENQNANNITNVNVNQGNLKLKIYMDGVQAEQAEHDEKQENHGSSVNIFETYIKKAVEYFSMKKTLLYEHQPHSFYELYVCNNLAYYSSQISGFRGRRQKKLINDATPNSLEEVSKYTLIAGTGGIGKSMFLTHIFLSSAQEYAETQKLPIFATLKDYRDKTQGLADFLLKSVKAFTPKISMHDLIEKLEAGKVFVMLDGLDELQSSLQEKFNLDLDDFIKAYPDNSIIITSRPTSPFVSYVRFSVLKIEPLTKKQAIQLISKLNYWNEQAKSDFLTALDKNLYRTHQEFASNPLLLTIMLMTYTTFGEVPAKIHVFYAKAYETMARLHDATKGSYQRPFNTKLTPEELAKLFASFCARTYLKEKIEFTSEEFASYMDKILSKNSITKNKSVTSRDFLLDLTNNLCIMYREGNTYYFIHRSFQEYFAALYFAFDYDENLKKVGDFFENTLKYSFTDRTFDMLYDMIPEKIERYIFLPYLEKLITYCEEAEEVEESAEEAEASNCYWRFLEKCYPKAYYMRRNGNIRSLRFETESFLYEKIVEANGLKANPIIRDASRRMLERFGKDWLETYPVNGENNEDFTRVRVCSH